MLTGRPSLGGLGFGTQPDLVGGHVCEMAIGCYLRKVDVQNQNFKVLRREINAIAAGPMTQTCPSSDSGEEEWLFRPGM